jgi:hypothetical protein
MILGMLRQNERFNKLSKDQQRRVFDKLNNDKVKTALTLFKDDEGKQFYDEKTIRASFANDESQLYTGHGTDEESVEAPFIDPIDIAAGVVSAPIGAARVGTKALLKTFGNSAAENIGRKFAATPGYFAKTMISGSATDIAVGGAVDELMDNDHPFLASSVAIAGSLALGFAVEPKLERGMEAIYDLGKKSAKTAKLGAVSKFDNLQETLGNSPKPFNAIEQMDNLGGEFYGGFDRRAGINSPEAIDTIKPAKSSLDEDFLVEGSFDNFHANALEANGISLKYLTAADYTPTGIKNTAIRTGLGEFEAKLALKKAADEELELELQGKRAKEAKHEYLTKMKGLVDKPSAKLIDSAQPDQVVLFGENPSKYAKRVLFVPDKKGTVSTARITKAVDEGKVVFTGKIKNEDELAALGYFRDKSDVYKNPENKSRLKAADKSNGAWGKSTKFRNANHYSLVANRISQNVLDNKKILELLGNNGRSLEGLNNGNIVEEVLELHKGIYSRLKPGMPDTDFRIVRKDLEALEDSLEPMYKIRPRYNKKHLNEQLNKLVKDGVIPEDMVAGYRQFFGTLKKYPDVELAASSNFNLPRSGYSAFFNRVHIKNPSDIMHEIGHWSWYNVLTKKDRMDFLDTLYGNYKNLRQWNTAFPKRLMYMREMKKLVDEGKIEIKDYHRWMQWSMNPKELFAELINQHAFTNILPGELQKTFVQRTMTLMKKFFNSVLRKRKGAPKELAPFIDKAFRPEFAQSRIAGKDRLFAKVENSGLFIAKEELDGSQESTDPFIDALVKNDKDAMTVLELLKLRLLPNEEARRALNNSEKFQELRNARQGKDFNYEGDDSGLDPDEVFMNVIDSGVSKFDLEGMFDSFRLNMMKWFHGIDDGVDEKALNELNEWFHDLFKPMNRDTAMQFIRQDRGTEVRSSRYGSKLDPQTGMERSAEELHSSRKGYGAKKGLQEILDESADDMIYRSFQREFEELDAMLNIMRIKKSKGELNALPSKDQMTVERGLRTLMDERDIPVSKSQVSTMELTSTVMPQFISALFGVEFNSENGIPIPGSGVYVNWSPETWITNWGGMGPALSAYGLFGRRGKRMMGRFLEPKREKFLLMMKNFDFKHSGELPYDMAKRTYQAFHPNEGMSEGVGKAMRKYNADVHEVQRKINEAAEHIQKNFSRTERIHMAEFIERNGDYDLSNVSENVKEQANAVKSLLKTVRERLIDAGFPREELERYGDRYLMRLYATDRGDKSVKSSYSAVQRANAWKKLSGSFLQRRGARLSISNKTFEDAKVGDVFYGTPKKTGGDWGIDWKSGPQKGAVSYEVLKNKKGEITFQRDFTRQERAELGEVTDIVPRLVEFGRLVTRDVALSKMFRKMEGMTDHVLDEKAIQKLADERITLKDDYIEELKNQGWSEVPHTTIQGTKIKRFGKLAGKLVSPDVMRALEMSTGKLPKSDLTWRTVDAYQKVLRAWKVGKTAFNPGTHGRNWACNLSICALDDREPLGVIKLGTKHLREKDSVFNLAIEHGMLDSTMIRSELGLDGFMRGLDSIQPNSRNLLMKTFDATLKNPVKKTARSALRAYELGDEIFKMGVFAQEIAKGKSPEEAINAAKRLFFDYRDVPSGVRALRDSGAFPFCSYSYKIVGLLTDVAAKQPWKLAALLGSWEMMDNFMYQAEYGKNAKAEEALQEEIAPDWMGKKAFGFGNKMSVHMGKGGKPWKQYEKKFDYGGAVPGGDINNFFGGFPFGTHPAISIVYGLFSGKDAQMDREFQWEFDSGMPLLSKNNESAIKERVRFIANALLPNLPYPGSYSFDKLGNALVAEGTIPRGTNGWTGEDYYGNDASIAEELINFTGMGKIRRLYKDEEFNRSIITKRNSIRKEVQRLRRKARSSSTSDKELDALERNIEERAAFAIKEIERLEQMKREADS